MQPQTSTPPHNFDYEAIVLLMLFKFLITFLSMLRYRILYTILKVHKMNEHQQSK